MQDIYPTPIPPIGLMSGMQLHTITATKLNTRVFHGPSMYIIKSNIVSIYIYSYSPLHNPPSRQLRLLCRLIIHITEPIILKRPIKPGPLIRRQRNPLAQPIHQVRVTSERPSEQDGIVAAGLQHAPGVLVVVTAGGKERRGAEDLAEAVEIDVRQAPGGQEGVFFFSAEDLFIALFMVNKKGVFRLV